MSLTYSLSHAASFEENQIPKVVKDLIENERKNCSEIEDLDNKPGIYKIGTSLKKISYLNHSIEYIVHSSRDQFCSSAGSLFQPSGGFYLTIFSNHNKDWEKIFDDLVLDYSLISPNEQSIPTNIVTFSKGYPGVKTNKTEFEWDQKSSTYVQKNIKENIYNLK